MQFLKAILFGTPRMGISALQIALEVILGRINWTVILERFLTRVLVFCLTWLAGLSTNRIYKETVKDVLKDFERRGLTKAVAYEARRIKRNHPGD